MPLGIEGIGQIALGVHDLTRAVGFYRDTLGLPFLFETETMAFFDCGGVRLMLAMPEGAGLDRASSTIYYRVADIDAAYARLRDAGVEPADVGGAGVPHRVYTLGGVDGYMCFFRDPERNLVALMSEVPAASR